MNPVLLAPLFQGILKIVDQVVPDTDQATKIKAEIERQKQSLETEFLKTARDVLVAEISGESWLQRNWRPLVMLFLTGLVGAHWLGFTAPNISDAIAKELLDIVQVGIGGYVVGRSVEKSVKAYTQNMKG